MKKIKNSKVLIYGNRKADDLIIDASTPEKEQAAYLYLFNFLDESWEVYSDLKEASSGDKTIIKEAEELEKGLKANTIPTSLIRAAKETIERAISLRKNRALSMKHKELYDEAKKGDAKAAQRLLEGRREYEYEEWRVDEIINPLKDSNGSL